MAKCGKCKSGPGHELHWSHTLNCEPCHRRWCFKRLLELKTHSTDALLRFDEGGDAFHQLHLEAMKHKGRNDIDVEVKEAEKGFSRRNYRDLLLSVANKYRTCWPVQAEFTTLGFYDLKAHDPPAGKGSVLLVSF